MVNVAERFAENLLIHRRRAGLSQEALGFRAEVHRTEIGQLERGHRLPRIDTVVKLAGALGIDPALLLAGIVWAPGEPTSGRLVGRYAVSDG